MPDPNRLSEIFQQARTQLGQVDSVRPEVERRIAALSPGPSPWSPSRLVIPSVAFLALFAFFWWRLAPSPSPAPHRAPSLAEISTLMSGDVELVEHVAAALDHRAVLVIWSYRGPGVSTDPTEHRSGKYRLRTLHHHTTPDGRTLVWSLFIPDPGVLPTFEPPSVSATLADDTRLAFSASCQRTSAADFAAALRSAHLADRSGPTPDDILQAIDTETR